MVVYAYRVYNCVLYYNHMPKHSMCPLTAGAPIWAHMLNETLFKHIEHQQLYFRISFLFIAAAVAFFQLNIGAVVMFVVLLAAAVGAFSR